MTNITNCLVKSFPWSTNGASGALSDARDFFAREQKAYFPAGSYKMKEKTVESSTSRDQAPKAASLLDLTNFHEVKNCTRCTSAGVSIEYKYATYE